MKFNANVYSQKLSYFDKTSDDGKVNTYYFFSVVDADSSWNFMISKEIYEALSDLNLPLFTPINITVNFVERKIDNKSFVNAYLVDFNVLKS